MTAWAAHRDCVSASGFDAGGVSVDTDGIDTFIHLHTDLGDYSVTLAGAAVEAVQMNIAGSDLVFS